MVIRALSGILFGVFVGVNNAFLASWSPTYEIARLAMVCSSFYYFTYTYRLTHVVGILDHSSLLGYSDQFLMLLDGSTFAIFKGLRIFKLKSLY